LRLCLKRRTNIINIHQGKEHLKFILMMRLMDLIEQVKHLSHQFQDNLMFKHLKFGKKTLFVIGQVQEKGLNPRSLY